jgi:hypothetical protein
VNIRSHVTASAEQQASQPTTEGLQSAQLPVTDGEVFEDNRADAITQRRLRTLAGNAPQALQLQAM